MLPYITLCYIDSRFFLRLEQSRTALLGSRLAASRLREAARWQWFRCPSKQRLRRPKRSFIILDIKTANLCFTLVNLYAPNKDDPFYFQNVENQLLEFDCDDIVLGGDLNLIKNTELGKESGIPRTLQTKALADIEKSPN